MKKVIILLTFIAIILAIPFAMDWLIIGNEFPSNISNTDWVSFLSGYIGSIVSMLGIIITIWYTNSQNKKDRENQVKPYCVMEYSKTRNISRSNRLLGLIQIGCEKLNGTEKDCFEYRIYVKNVGLGPAIEFDISIEDFDDGRDHYLSSVQRGSDNENSSINTLIPNEEAVIILSVRFNFDAIPDEAVTKYYEEEFDMVFPEISPEYMNKYKKHDFVIRVTYRDMYQNLFEQRIILYFEVKPIIDPDGHAHFEGGYYFKDTTNPVKLTKRTRNKKQKKK